jgi:molybdopterin-biosynthesis enzyme MoeA-like protein
MGLSGSVTNTNAAFLGRQLSSDDFLVVRHQVCGDSKEAIRFSIQECFRNSDIVFVLGGLALRR